MDGQQPGPVSSNLFDDPIYQKTLINTFLFLVFGVNLKLFFALLLSGFFMRKGWWVKGLLMLFVLPVGRAGIALLHLDSLDAEWRMGLYQ